MTVATPDTLSVTLAAQVAQPTTVVFVTGSALSTPFTVMVPAIGSRMVISGGVTSTWLRAPKPAVRPAS